MYWKSGPEQAAYLFQTDAIMRYTLQTTLLTAILMVSVWAFAAPVSQFDAVQEMARKDYEAAMAGIASVSKADQFECAKQAGPAAKACTIQADGKRDAAEEEAKLALARARQQIPALKSDQEKAAAAGKRKAKVEYGVAKARIKRDRNLANAECSKLKKDEGRRCKKEVNDRYAIASDFASAAHVRAIAKADAIVER